MTLEIALLLGIILFAVVAFAREWMPMDVVALTALGLLLLFGLVTPEEAISGFSNPAVITVMMMFVLSAGLSESGLVSKLGYRISEMVGADRAKATALLLLLAGCISAFLNNTAAVAVLMPVAIHLARHYRFSPSRILLPLSYTAIFGGTCTLIGTSTNLVVSSLAETSGAGAFSMFEFLGLGAAFFVVGMVYNLVLPGKLLTARTTSSSLTRKYHLGGFLTEVRIPEGSPILGKTVLEEQVSDRFHLNVLEIIRGTQKIYIDIRHTALRVDDILLVRGSVEDIVAFREHYRLLLLTDVKLQDADLSDRHTILAELQLSPLSRFVGKTLKEIDFRQRFDCFVLALSRTSEFIHDKLASIPLDRWDTLLVFGPRSRVEALYELDDFMPLGENELRLHLSARWWISALIMPLVVILAATGAMPILKAAILGAVTLLVTRCITIQQAYRGIDWTVIFLLAAVLPLGIAMNRTGLAEEIGNFFVPIGVNYGPTAMLSAIYLAANLLTAIFSNNATAVLMVPVAIASAAHLGIDSKPLLMAVTYAASASFITPIGYQTNTMVFSPGNYQFMDYVRYGTPLTVLYWLMATWLIPRFWPF